MKTLIRFDDICPTMDWKQWNKAEELLRKYDIKPLLGVIPDCQDPELQIDPPRPDFWKWVKEKQNKGYAIAMHGVYHLYRTNKRGLISNGYNSEFAGLPYEEQVKILLRGKEILKTHGIETDIFFAPSHSYDENTIKALADCGFKYISDGKTLKPVCRHGIVCIPCKSGFKGFFIREQYQTKVHHVHTWKYPQFAYGYAKYIKDCQNDNIVNWFEYIDRSNGNLFAQNFYEKYFLFIERNIYPFLIRIKHSMLKIMQMIEKIIKTLKHIIRAILLRTWDAISPWIPDRLFIRVKFRLRLGYWPNLSSPQTFNEKLQWLKLNNQKDIYTIMVDKFEAKEYVRSIIGDKYIVPTLGVWDRVDEIDFDILPNQFVLKVTHDSGGVCICGDKESFDKERAIRKLSQSLVKSYFYQNREWPYKNVERKIIAEEFLGNNLQDYRVYCFNGEPKLIYSYTNKSEADGSKPEPAFCDIMDIEWHPQPFRQMCRPRGGVDKPAHLSEMLRISKILSRNIPFVRVDFYEGKQLLVGELTFYPGSGMSKFFPFEMDKSLGEWINLDILQ